MGTMEVVVTIFICFNACECLRLPISNNLLPNLPWPINETFRFTDDPSPAKKSNPARAASSPKPAPKPKKETPETLRAKIEKMQAKAVALDDKLTEMKVEWG